MDYIHIHWEGHWSLEEVTSDKTQGNDPDTDYGIYQIYGAHPIYGHDVLLYIGKASQQTFSTRIGQEKHWWYNQDAGNVKIYLGRLFGITPSDEVWTDQISKAEKLLIHSHRPAHNSSNINSIQPEELENTHVLNYGNHRSLLPEVSSIRLFDEQYGEDGEDDYYSMTNIK